MTTIPVEASPRAVPAPPIAPERPVLVRPRECLVTGTAAGLAVHLGWPAWAVRTLFALAAPLLGAGLLLYLWLWMFVPWAEGDRTPSRKAPVAWVLAVVAVVPLLPLLIGALDGSWYSASFRYPAVWLLILVSAVGAGVWANVIDASDPARGPRHARIISILMAVVLGSLLLLELGGATRTGFLGPLLPVVGLIAVGATPLIARWRELSGERIRRIREEQRAQMAAHLHDSVLQTLALIQNRAGASSEVARIARAQERELRAWLYDGDAPADSDLPTDLRDYGGALELDYPVRIDVVSAGLSTERASGEVAAAAREAMLNAARHAGGEVSAYIEGSATGVEVYVRDRGEGFDPVRVGDDRLGVRESIIGRMRRIGGTATVRSDASGTEVHLRYRGTGFGENGFPGDGGAPWLIRSAWSSSTTTPSSGPGCARISTRGWRSSARRRMWHPPCPSSPRPCPTSCCWTCTSPVPRGRMRPAARA